MFCPKQYGEGEVKEWNALHCYRKESQSNKCSLPTKYLTTVPKHWDHSIHESQYLALGILVTERVVNRF